MFIQLNDDYVSVYAIVRIYQSVPNQVWISLSDGTRQLLPQFKDVDDLKNFIINEITRMTNDS